MKLLKANKDRFFLEDVKNPKTTVITFWRKKEHAIRTGNRKLAKKLRRRLRTINSNYMKYLSKAN